MGAMETQESTDQIRWFKEQVTRLYSKNLFLRQEEIESLQESARIVDLYAARQFVNQSNSDSEERTLSLEIVQKLITELRKLQTRSKAGNKRLAFFREQAIAFRRAQMKRGRLSQWLSGVTGSEVKKRRENLQNANLSLDMASTELRHKVALKILILIICDAYAREQKSRHDRNVDNVLRLLSLRSQMKRKRRFYRNVLNGLSSQNRLIRNGG